MKRIVILIDGTWNDESGARRTNVATLDQMSSPPTGALIKGVAADGTAQHVRYHKGVGSNADDVIGHWLGGSIGLGLRDIVLDAYRTVVHEFQPGDDLILCGFSRGAYAVRALAGMIGASGIQMAHAKENAQAAWDHYRLAPAKRAAAPGPPADVHPDRRIKCVAVWDTVGSYGVPAGLGLDALARYYAWTFLGFHDTEFGGHIENGLHAVAIDERRRPFVPTLWTAPKGKPPKGYVEQTWFVGDHGNVGGGEPDAGLSDEAMLWMIARLEALTGLEFDHPAVWAATKPNLDGEVYDSTVGWLIDHQWPHLRTILSPDAIEHGAVQNKANTAIETLNERVHWSAIEKRGRKCTVFGQPNTPYAPANLPPTISQAQIAAITPEEQVLFRRTTGV
jgi:hypothetical protein